MRWTVVVAVLSAAVSGCGRAEAIVPDSTNPAHCLAAYNHGAFWLSKDPAHRPRVAHMIAHGIFDMNKLKAAGRSIDAAKKEGKALTETYVRDDTKMDELLLACSMSHANDPEFRKQWPALLTLAKAKVSDYPSP